MGLSVTGFSQTSNDAPLTKEQAKEALLNTAETTEEGKFIKKFIKSGLYNLLNLLSQAYKKESKLDRPLSF